MNYNFTQPSPTEIKRNQDNDKLRRIFNTPIVSASVKRSEKKYRTVEPSGLVHCAKNSCRDKFHKDLPGVLEIESKTFDKRKNKMKVQKWYYCQKCSESYSGKLKKGEFARLNKI